MNNEGIGDFRDFLIGKDSVNIDMNIFFCINLFKIYCFYLLVVFMNFKSK